MSRYQAYQPVSSIFAQGSNKVRVSTCIHEKRNETRLEKTNILVSDLVQHKPGCTATADS